MSDTAVAPANSMPRTIDPRAFRTALGRYPTGVAVVTALDAAGRPVGMTINSFASVSLEPPLVLWSVQRTTPSSEAFRKAPRFAICVLAADQEDMALRFARTDENKFRDLTVETGLGGLPLIPGALATFECRTWAVYPGGDHEILVGEVEQLSTRPGAPLGFHGGRLLAFDTPQD
ncbi:flavin reductase family protein [Pedomonas sp. V897]|uniref:flavin reductase family protein n=1 Tax=Pedomonas sp. V897 TaxID=3446482 RepID=UPI003EE321DF